MILYFKCVIWNVCLKVLVKSLFCSIVRVGIRKSWIFPKLVKLDPCSVANLFEVFGGIKFGSKVCFSFQVEMFNLSDSEKSILKNQFKKSNY